MVWWPFATKLETADTLEAIDLIHARAVFLPDWADGRATALPLTRSGGGRGYHCTCWSNKYAGSGCARASQSGTASASAASHAGGPRAGAIGGG